MNAKRVDVVRQVLTRRKMILASGIVVSGLAQSANAEQDPADKKDIIFHTKNPNNGEPELEKLIQSWLTPTKHFYVRSHAPNPRIAASTFRLNIDGMVDNPTNLSLEQLKQLPEHTITATLTCAGNRRAEYSEEGSVGGVQWQAGAIGNATWTGVLLADVLKMVGVQKSAKHICFEGLDEIKRSSGVIPFGASIPMEKAVAGDPLGALLVYKMNGENLTADHGYPLRTIVPGYIGARSVKWLGKVTVSDRPSKNHYVATAYKIVRDTSDISWAESGPIYRYPINAAVASVKANQTLKPGPLTLRGYVLPSGKADSKVKSVLVSVDSGKTWAGAKMTGKDQSYCWQLWQASVNITASTNEILVRATDSESQFMPVRVPWNAKGYLQNSWFRLPVKVG